MIVIVSEEANDIVPEATNVILVDLDKLDQEDDLQKIYYDAVMNALTDEDRVAEVPMIATFTHGGTIQHAIVNEFPITVHGNVQIFYGD